MGVLAALVERASLVLVAPATADVVTNADDDLRTGWYPDEASLTPQLVSGGTFGQLWSADVDGQVYAQPLLRRTARCSSPPRTTRSTGWTPRPARRNGRRRSTSARPWNPADIGCGDLTPNIGVTATPVIDTSTNTVYLTHKTYASGTTGNARGSWTRSTSRPDRRSPASR